MNKNRFQLHIHSSYSIDTPMSKRNIGSEIVKRGKGIQVIITDHDNIDYYNDYNNHGKYHSEFQHTQENNLIVSSEVTIVPKKGKKLSYFPNVMFHYLLYGIKNIDDVLELAKKGDMDEFYSMLRHEKNMRHALAHPITRIPGDPAVVEHRVEVAKHYADVLELNSSSTKLENILTMTIARDNNKGLIIGGDDHVGNPLYGTMFSSKSDFYEFYETVKSVKVHKNYVEIGGFYYKIPSMNPLRQQRITLQYISQLMKSDESELKRKGFNPLFGSQFFDRFVIALAYGDYAKLKNFFFYPVMFGASIFGDRYFKYFIINPRNNDIKNYLRKINMNP